MFQRDYDEHSDEVLRVALNGDEVLFQMTRRESPKRKV